MTHLFARSKKKFSLLNSYELCVEVRHCSTRVIKLPPGELGTISKKQLEKNCYKSLGNSLTGRKGTCHGASVKQRLILNFTRLFNLAIFHVNVNSANPTLSVLNNKDDCITQGAFDES